MSDPARFRTRLAWPAAGIVLIGMAVLLLPRGMSDLLVMESGGEGTTFASDRNAFGNSARNLSSDERRRFEVGDSFFTQNWVIAPSSTDVRDGLGPLFNAQSCSSCHLRDGRGSVDDGELGLLFRLSVPSDSGLGPDPVYGGQLQDRSVPGLDPEGEVMTMYVEERDLYPDGTPYVLRRPVHELGDLAYGPISIDVLLAPRLAPPVFGTGLLEAIPVDDILSHADPDDTDGDGVSGRPNYLLDESSGEMVLGRFGWKANVTTIQQQTANAFLGDIGITSPVHLEQNCTIIQIDCIAAPDGGSPEIGSDLFSDVVFYTRTLAVPSRRTLENPGVVAGAEHFELAGCPSCHSPRHVTGSDPIEALADQVIFPFSDLLLHDMGPGLADGVPDGLASGNEWRTPPLWGLGLTAAVNGNINFLHDGRARTLEEAILWHDGEAEAARDSFKHLDADQRAELVAFLESL